MNKPSILPQDQQRRNDLLRERTEGDDGVLEKLDSGREKIEGDGGEHKSESLDLVSNSFYRTNVFSVCLGLLLKILKLMLQNFIQIIDTCRIIYAPIN